MSYTFDAYGHLPSWVNSFLYSPSHFHNVILSSTSQPVIYLDILPFRTQIFGTIKLLQDNVEMGSYRVNKWLYRASFSLTAGQIVSDEGLESVDEGWHGKVVIEAPGTSESAKDLISRCAGPASTLQQQQALYSVVLEGKGTSPLVQKPAVLDAKGARLGSTTPWVVLRERSRPGLIYISPVTAPVA